MRSKSYFHTAPSQIPPQTGGHISVTKATLELCRHLVELDSHTTEFDRVRKFFLREDVWPDQCDYTIRVLTRIQKPIRNINEIVNSNFLLTKEISVNRYAFLTKSHALERIIFETLSRVLSYKNICQSASQEKEREFKKITYDLERLWEGYSSLQGTLEKIICSVPEIKSKIS